MMITRTASRETPMTGRILALVVLAFMAWITMGYAAPSASAPSCRSDVCAQH